MFYYDSLFMQLLLSLCLDGGEESKCSENDLSDIVTITRKGPAENVQITSRHSINQVEVDIDFLVTLPLDLRASRQSMAAFREIEPKLLPMVNSSFPSFPRTTCAM